MRNGQDAIQLPAADNDKAIVQIKGMIYSFEKKVSFPQTNKSQNKTNRPQSGRGIRMEGMLVRSLLV